jgi:hypothetical protein
MARKAHEKCNGNISFNLDAKGKYNIKVSIILHFNHQHLTCCVVVTLIVTDLVVVVTVFSGADEILKHRNHTYRLRFKFSAIFRFI